MSIRAEINSDRVKPFIILNHLEEVFQGMKGGMMLWSGDITQGKIFDQESKFIGLEKLHPNTNLTKLTT